MRNWKPYSSVARDGEKTVYCEKGNHSVYYGDAFISFKPSKLIWCIDCKNTYYEVKPTLFDEVVKKQQEVEMDATQTARQEWEEERRKEDEWLEKNPYHQFQYPVEFDIVKTTKDGRVLVTCTRCKGCGKHSFNLRDGSTCWGCQGTGLMQDPLMTEPQIKFIRQLFKSVKDMMTIDEQEELIAIMKGAINKTKRVNKFWASQTIETLQALQTQGGK